MNQKQVKLLRYFCRESGDLPLAAKIQTMWPTLDHKQKEKITRWLKRVVVSLMGIKSENKRKQLESNLKTLKGFIT